MSGQSEISQLDLMRIKFGAETLAGIQDLIRLLDQKVGLVSATVTLLSSALLALLAASLKRGVDWDSGLVVAVALWYLWHLAEVLLLSVCAIRARRNSLGNHCGAPELTFPLMLLRRTDYSDLNYLKALRHLQPDDLLREYAQQILEVSNIYEEKLLYANRAADHLVWLGLAWFACLAMVAADRLLVAVYWPYHLLVLAAMLAVLIAVGCFFVDHVRRSSAKRGQRDTAAAEAAATKSA